MIYKLFTYFCWPLGSFYFSLSVTGGLVIVFRDFVNGDFGVIFLGTHVFWGNCERTCTTAHCSAFVQNEDGAGLELGGPLIGGMHDFTQLEKGPPTKKKMNSVKSESVPKNKFKTPKRFLTEKTLFFTNLTRGWRVSGRESLLGWSLNRDGATLAAWTFTVSSQYLLQAEAKGNVKQV